MVTVNGKQYTQLIGSRAQVWHGTAYKTKGQLKRDHLMMNKRGRVVSKKKHNRCLFVGVCSTPTSNSEPL